MALYIILIESIINKIPKNKESSLDGFTGYFNKDLRKKLY